ncbi:MAG: hypothetical protein A3B70_07320 [Deltaproteobacteria bacterium RIFCSPHIGHO2_02_FULL_40_11]|nr:MAG: hypothetical protein A3B70_07320 [Deltaproteobacteria bacterium RIFCSPHIGHO2_02_FULL_40_11]
MKNFYLLLVVILVSCSSTPKPVQKPISDNYDQLWNAAYKVAITYPLKDFSKKSGTLESEWIYLEENHRYKFFITLEKKVDTFQLEIDTLHQTQASKQAPWRWHAPLSNIQEQLKMKIHESLS